ncbi:Endopolyphosphatase [Thoreauomyces humboldtii]|nr:Endopolyphosphatase [Thoreauomyces humboldtii]
MTFCTRRISGLGGLLAVVACISLVHPYSVAHAASLGQASLLTDEDPIVVTKTPTGRFLHLTDIHLDPYYQEGATLASACHRVETSSRHAAGQLWASRRKPKEGLAGKYGAPGSGCDSPIALLNATANFARDVLLPDGLDFIIWTGDNARHDTDGSILRTVADIQSQNYLAVDYLLRAFPASKTSSSRHPSIPIIPNIGNNDVWPHNDIVYTPNRRNPILDFFAALWDRFIPEDQIPAFRKHGCFFVEPVKDLIVASINTMYLSDANRQVGDCRAVNSLQLPVIAGDAVLQWLEEHVLLPAEREGKAVYLIGHVPPNPLNYFDVCYESFARLMVRYSNTITGQFYGHMNIDHFFFPSSIIPVGKSIPYQNPDTEPVTERAWASLLRMTAPDFSNSVSTRDPDPTAIGVLSMIPSWINLYYHYLLTHYKHLAHQHARVPTTRVLQPVFVAPSVVPTFNPGIRTYTYHVVDKEDPDDRPTTSWFPSWLRSWGTRGRRAHRRRHRHRHDSHRLPLNPDDRFNDTLIRTGDLSSYTQYYADLDRWNSDPLDTNPEFPGHIYQTSYDPAVIYGFAEGRFDRDEWMRFGGRMSVEGTGKGGRESERLRRVFADQMVVQLKGVEVKDI